MLVNDGAAGKDHVVLVLGDRDRQVLPVHHVGADGVSPAHVSPNGAERIVLVEEVIFALEVDHPVGVVHKVLRRSEVVLRTIGLGVWSLRQGNHAAKEYTQDHERPHLVLLDAR